MQSGTDLTYGAIARVANVQERTVYRHFPAKVDLQTGLWEWITSRLTHTDFAARTADELVADMRRAFVGFDASAALIQSMLHSPQGVEVRVRQQPARRAMFRGCVDAAVPDATPEVRERAAAALQVLYSAPSWDLLRTFWDMDAGQAADTIELAIRSMLAGLRAASQPPQGPPASGPSVPVSISKRAPGRAHQEGTPS
jgi:AcrR family transcriptional regulator